MLVDELKAARRAENRSAGRRLAVVGEVDSCRLRQLGGRETWCTDTQEAVAAEEAAALRVGQALATSHLYYARAMRTRLPLVERSFATTTSDASTPMPLLDETTKLCCLTHTAPGVTP